MRRIPLTGPGVAASVRSRLARICLVHRNNLENSKLSRRFKGLMTRLAPYAAAASAALILWHAARDTPTSVVFVPAPLVYPHAPAAATAPTPRAIAAVQVGPPGIAQQAS